MKRPARKLLILALFLASACASAPPRPSPPAQAGVQSVMQPREVEVAILRLEDRREYDSDLIGRFVSHPDPTIRARAALALGRIGEATFIDMNQDGRLDPDETQAGVSELLSLADDADPRVRRATAFALGEIADSHAVDTLLALTSDEDDEVAAEAVEALSKMAETIPTERYVAIATSDGRRQVRRRAIRYMFRLPGDAPLETATVLLRDPAPEGRLEASYVFSRRPHSPAREILEALLADESDAVTRSYAARGLGRIGDPRSLGPLHAGFDDPHPWVRINAARSIAQIAGRDVEALRTASLADDVARTIRHTDDPDDGTTVEAILVLGYYARIDQSAKTRLTELAATSDRAWFRETALGALSAHFGEEDSGAVLSLIDGRSRWQKIEVIQNGSSHPTFGPAVRSRFADDEDASVRASVVGSIPDERVDAEVELIQEAMNDSDIVVRASAIDRYAKTKTPTDVAVAALRNAEQRARGDAMNDARIAAIRALTTHDVDGRAELLSRLIRDSDPVVRRVAADLVEQVLEQPRPQYTPLPIDRAGEEYREIAEWSQRHHTARIRTGAGDIDVVLMTDEAPMTTWNFASLARKGYFDHTSFMRVVPNFVIQGGDPRNDMSGGPGYAIRDEMNPLDYTRGAVGMALSGPDTGGSQFFITHSPQHHLDGGYTIFGRVIDGLTHSVDEMNRGDPVSTILIDDFEIEAGTDIFRGAKIPLPLVTGIVDEDFLLRTVPGYSSGRDAYEPDSAVVDLMAAYVQPGDTIEVILGTWCSDSLREVPKFLKIMSILRNDYGVEIPTTYVAVNRAKQRPAELIAGRDIEKVATFIYYRNGEETGRIVESPVGIFEDDLLAAMAGGS